MAVSGSKSFIPCVVSAHVVAEAIRATRDRLFYCSPGITLEESTAIIDASQRMDSHSIWIYVDGSASACIWGYGAIAALQALANAKRVGTFALNGVRLGLLITDDLAYVFSRSPESIEALPQSGEAANGLLLRKDIADVLFDSLRTKSADRPPVLDRAAVERMKAEIEQSGETDPRERRLLEAVRHQFKLVRLRHQVPIQSKAQRYRGGEVGFEGEGINEHLSAKWENLTARDRNEINRPFKILDQIKDKYLRSLHPYGYALWVGERANFESQFGQVKERTQKTVEEWLRGNYPRIVERNRKEAQRFLEQLFEKLKPKPDFAAHAKGMTDAEWRQHWISNEAKKYELPKLDDVLKKIQVEFDVYDISAELLKKKDFVEKLEKAFGFKLEDLLAQEKGKTIEEMPAATPWVN
jgi:hypothetical protein